MNSYKEKWCEKYNEFILTMDDQEAMDAADEYMEDYISQKADYDHDAEREEAYINHP
jgi:hypothetical protein